MIQFCIEHAWALKLSAIIFFTFGLSIFEGKVYSQLYPKLKESRRVWDDALLFALHMPLKIYIWLSGLSFSLMTLGRNLIEDPYIQETIKSWHALASCCLLFWVFQRFINHCDQNTMTPKKLGKHDPTNLGGLIQVFRVVVIVIGGMLLMQFFGIPLSGVIAFGGIGGIAVGFAAKDMLANFFGGLMIFYDQPFKIGDWIRSPDKEIEGTVEHIGWRLTRIRTFDKRPLFVPNSFFSTISLENPSRMSNRRIKVTFGLCYEDFSVIAKITSSVEKMLKEHPEIDTRHTCFVNVADFGPYALHVEVYTFTKTTDWVKYQAIKEDVILKIVGIVHSYDCHCAYPVSSHDLAKAMGRKGLLSKEMEGVLKGHSSN